MIEYIKGEFVELSPTQIILDCNNIGYEINISLTTFSALEDKKSGKLYIFEVIREDAHTLYGFATLEERELFIKLISVSGVGPNTARMILSSLAPSELIQSISSGDDKSLTMVKGIGTKTAQRIIVDLKNKVRTIENQNISTTNNPYPKIAEEAILALVMLGFPKAASQKVIDTILKKESDLKVEELIKIALKML